jgi:hypothetical protein
MEQARPAERRRNRAILWMIGGMVLIGVALPPLWAREQQPRSAFATYADARRAGAMDRGLMPRRLPASATEIYEKHFTGAGHHWVRFRFGSQDSAALVAGLTPLTPEQVKRLDIPSPGWATWWLLDQGVTTSSQGKRVVFYRAEDGWLMVDPRTRTAYFWT